MRREPWVDEHLAQIDRDRRALTRLQRRSKQRGNVADAQVIASMIADLRWTAEYLRTRPWLPAVDPEDWQSNVRELEVWAPDELDTLGGELAVPASHNRQLTTEQRSALAQALGKLTPAEREVYVMTRGYLLTHTEIAKRLNTSRGNVYNLLTRAEEKLRGSEDLPVQLAFL